jgi:hypothetical protein
MFRVTINEKYRDMDLLGDRVLAAWIGSDGEFVFSTYNYADLAGNGNANSAKTIEHEGAHTVWSFVYFGYNRKRREAFSFVKLMSKEATLTWSNHNHFLSKKFYVFLGRDAYHPYWNGMIRYFRMHFGRGAYKTEHFGDEDFALKVGIAELLPDPEFKHVWHPEGEEEESIIDLPFDAEKPVINTEEEETENFKLNGLSEYAWGLWSRWSRTGPKGMPVKKEFHSLARFTTNRNHGDIGMKDRTLAVWIGAGFYHFTTYTIEKGKADPNLF